MKQTQRAWVESQLREHGEITRNTALRNYVSRLAAIITLLKEDGWELEGFDRDGDYVYALKKEPVKKKFAPVQLYDEHGRPRGVRLILVP